MNRGNGKSETIIDQDMRARSVMEETDMLFARLDQNENVDAIRIDIANLIVKYLGEKRDTFGYWEKAHFANAIASLAQNVFSSHQPTTAWLRASLVNVEKALVPPDQRNESYTRRDNQLDALTFDQLVDDIRKLGGRV
jgi:hypothetical protein